jgi:DnaK suppressor protein
MALSDKTVEATLVSCEVCLEQPGNGIGGKHRRRTKREHYRRRLLAEEQEVLTRLERAVASVSEPGDGVPHDTADESSSRELKYRQLAQAEAARSLLNQVRNALDRIENGTFGRCAEDGEPIEDARLEAVPWAAYCERHDRRRSSTM